MCMWKSTLRLFCLAITVCLIAHGGAASAQQEAAEPAAEVEAVGGAEAAIADAVDGAAGAEASPAATEEDGEAATLAAAATLAISARMAPVSARTEASSTRA